MSRAEEEKLSVGSRMAEERERLGKSRSGMAHACGKTPQAIGEFERGGNFPGGAVLAGYARLGADVQYILTGVRSDNIDRVAEEAGTYNKQPQGVGALSKEEEVLLKKYRQLDPKKRTHAQAVVDALATAPVKEDKTG